METQIWEMDDFKRVPIVFKIMKLPAASCGVSKRNSPKANTTFAFRASAGRYAIHSCRKFQDILANANNQTGC